MPVPEAADAFLFEPPTAPLPSGFEVDSGPAFDAATHLALSLPSRVVPCDALGWAGESTAGLPTQFAQTSSFQVLSPAGLTRLTSELDRLEPLAIRCAGALPAALPAALPNFCLCIDSDL